MGARNAVEIRNLSKSFGRIRAVQELSLDVRDGEEFGFVGLNGAGKTTTIRMLLDLVRPSSGEARIFGKDCRAFGLEVRRRIGYLPGEPGLYADMTGVDVLDLLSRLSGVQVVPSYRDALLERFRLSPSDLRRPIRDYSSGMKRKLGLIQAFQSDPPLLILDEPTEGLDPLMQEALYELLDDLRRRGRTIFMSSHVLSEVERLCDRVGLIRDGRLVLLASVDEIRQMAPRQARIVFAREVRGAPQSSPECQVLEVRPTEWRFAVPGPMLPVLRQLEGFPVLDIEIVKPGLEDVLPKFYREGGE